MFMCVSRKGLYCYDYHIITIKCTLKSVYFFQTEYMNSKVYPIFPRYTILKDMIKDIMHHPDYMEVCHEVDV
jgi:hypothetical protein